MIILVQRVKQASVIINNKVFSSINNGLLLFLGIENKDKLNDIKLIIDKLLALRIFNDEKNKMNLSIDNIKGSILVVSQFTLCANLNYGNRPGFNNAKNKNDAFILYNEFIKKLKNKYKYIVKHGSFGSAMDIKLINDGPATFILNSKDK